MNDALQHIASNEQLAIYDAVQNRRDSLAVSAVAGAGKTTTIVEASKLVSPESRVLFSAFNKRIVEELKSRLRQQTSCKTLNSVGHVAWLKAGATQKGFDKEALFKIFDKPFVNVRGEERSVVKKLVGLAKNEGIVPSLESFPDEEREGFEKTLNRRSLQWPTSPGLCPDTEEEWLRLIALHDLDVSPETICAARRALAVSVALSRTLFDYSDQLYAPIVFEASFIKHDVIFLDEAQDVSRIQAEIVERSLKPGGRVILVGDPNQAIYGFRGCLDNALQQLAERFCCKWLPLSVSYRCPRSVVAIAQRYVPRIEPSADASEGAVLPMNYDEFEPSKFCANRDVVLCRNVAPLVRFRSYLREHDVYSRFAGEMIALQPLMALINKFGRRHLYKETFADSLREHLDIAEARFQATLSDESDGDKAAKIERLSDNVEIILACLDCVEDGDDFIERLKSEVRKTLLERRDSSLLLSTIHKAKGLEWERVFVVGLEKYIPSKYATRDWQIQQEKNVAYVAVTRAKSQLYLLAGF